MEPLKIYKINKIGLISYFYTDEKCKKRGYYPSLIGAQEGLQIYIKEEKEVEENNG